MKPVPADRFVDYYRGKRPKLFGKSLQHFVLKQMFAKFDLNDGLSPSSINRDAILHEGIALMAQGPLTGGFKSTNLSTYLECRRASFLSPLGLGAILFRIGPTESWDPAALLLPDIRRRLDPLGCSARVWTTPNRTDQVQESLTFSSVQETFLSTVIQSFPAWLPL